MIKGSLVHVLLLVLIVGIGGCAPTEKPPALASNQVTGLPATAKLLKEGKGRIDIDIRRSGILFLFDVNQGQVIWSGLAEAKEKLVIDPAEIGVKLNNLQVYDGPIDPTHWRRVYLDPG